MNKVVLIGRLARDTEVRYSQGETPIAIARNNVAVDRRVAKNGQENAQTADFISILAFGKRAEFLEKYGKKGVKFAIEGRIQTGSYEKDGVKHYTTDVVVENIEFCESKGNGGTGTTAPTTAPDDFLNIPMDIDDEIPFS